MRRRRELRSTRRSRPAPTPDTLRIVTVPTRFQGKLNRLAIAGLVLLVIVTIVFFATVIFG